MVPIQISLMSLALSACLPMSEEKLSVSLTDTPSSNAMPISIIPQNSSPLVQALFEAPTVARSFSAAIAAKAQVRIVTTEKSSKVDLSGSTGLTGENNHSTKGAAAATVKAYKLLYDNGQTDRSILLSELADVACRHVGLLLSDVHGSALVEHCFSASNTRCHGNASLARYALPHLAHNHVDGVLLVDSR